MTFARKVIEITFQLGTGSFGESGFNTMTVSGLRTTASVLKAGGISKNELQLRVCGLTLPTMKQLSTYGQRFIIQRRNIVRIAAGDAGTTLATVFSGTLFQGWVDLQAQPDVSFNVTAYAGLLDAVKPAPAISYPGSADTATVMQGLAKQMNLGFTNNGVNVQLASPYFCRTAVDQAQSCAQQANINMVIDDGTLAIWPKGAGRGGTPIVISPETGLVSYPAFSGQGIILTTLFNPALQFGCHVDVRSSLNAKSATVPGAPVVNLDTVNGIWEVATLAHELTSETPGGPWFSRIECVRPGTAFLI